MSSLIKENKNFKSLFLAGLLSEFGSFASETAIMLYLFDLTNSSAHILGLSKALFLLLFTVGSLFGGPIAEKFHRRNILIACEILRIPITIGILLTSEPYLIIIFNSLIGFFTGIFNPSRQALISQIVPEKDMQEANGTFASTNALLHIIGPILGATIYVAQKSIKGIIFFDLITYFIGIYLLLKIVITKPVNEEKFHLWNDLKSGIKFVTKRLDLISLYNNCFFTGLCIGILIPLLLPFTTEFLKKGQFEYGVLITAFGIGGVIGGWLYKKFSSKIAEGNLIIIMFLFEGICLFLWPLFNNFHISLFILLLWGIVVFLKVPAQLTCIHKNVEKNYIGRTMALLDLSFICPNIIGSMVVFVLGNRFSSKELIVYTSYFFLAQFFIRMLFPEGRALIKKSI